MNELVTIRNEVEFRRAQIRGCSEQDAKKAYAYVLGEVQQQRFNDPAKFAHGIITLFQNYPFDVVDRVVKSYADHNSWLDKRIFKEMLDAAVKPLWEELAGARLKLEMAERREELPPATEEELAKMRWIVKDFADRSNMRVASRPKRTRPPADKAYEAERLKRFTKGNAAPKSGESKTASAGVANPSTEDFSQEDELCQQS